MICRFFLWIALTFASLNIFFFSKGKAYAEFISYGYATCITCHYNGNGNGPLNDYGRALFAAEIASRKWYPSSVSDEAISNQGGFLGSVPLPQIIRPYVKYRGLMLNSPLGGNSPQSKYYNMQAEFGNTFQFDDAGKYLFNASWGHMVRPQDYAAGKSNLDHILATSYYGRVQMGDTWFVYAGLLEKVYGIRTMDHSSFQRTFQGFNPNNNSKNGIASSLGLIVQKAMDKWEVSVGAFGGHPGDDAAHRQKGASVYSDYEIGDRKRVGASVMVAQSQLLRKSMASVHYRQGIGKGHTLMGELGVIQDIDALNTSAVGSYGFVESYIGLTRGYNLVFQLEHYNKEFKPTSPDLWKYGFGVVAFPAPRLELRLGVESLRTLKNQQAGNDGWQMLGQVHVSL